MQYVNMLMQRRGEQTPKLIYLSVLIFASGLSFQIFVSTNQWGKVVVGS